MIVLEVLVAARRKLYCGVGVGKYRSCGLSGKRV